MKKTVTLVASVVLVALSAFAADKEQKEADRLNESAVVLKEILGMPESSIGIGENERAPCAKSRGPT